MEGDIKKKRLFYLDLLKFIPIVFMVFTHGIDITETLGIIGGSIDLNKIEIFENIIYIVGPTNFMFSMGVCMYIKKDSPERLFKRGLGILLIGFLLNLARGVVYPVLGFAGFCSITDGFLMYWYWLFGSDILYLAGLFYLFYALLKKLKCNVYICFLVSLLLNIAGNFLLGTVTIENETLNLIAGNFIYMDPDSYFPMLLWAIFPMVGILFQAVYEKVNDKEKYMAAVGVSGLAVFGITLLVLLLTGSFKIRYIFFGETGFVMDGITCILILSLNAAFIAFIYNVAKVLEKNSLIKKVVSVTSLNLTRLYCIHWIIYMYSAVFILLATDYRMNHIYEFLIYYFLVLAASIGLGNSIFRFRKRREELKKVCAN